MTNDQRIQAYQRRLANYVADNTRHVRRVFGNSTAARWQRQWADDYRRRGFVFRLALMCARPGELGPYVANALERNQVNTL
jgi:hypothetical protein